MAQLQQIAAPVSGTLRTRIDLNQRAAQGSQLDLALGQGRVRSEWLPSGGVAIDKGELHAIYAPESTEVRVERLALDLGGGAQLVLDGTLSGVTAALKHVPVARLGELWPAAFSSGGRGWVLDNIREGVLDEAALDLGFDLDPVARTANVLNAKGSLRYHDLTINYFNGLPLIRQVAGTAGFAGQHLDITPTSGQLPGMKVTGGL